jgi:uncharacterized protein (DUF983 family)
VAARPAPGGASMAGMRNAPPPALSGLCLRGGAPGEGRLLSPDLQRRRECPACRRYKQEADTAGGLALVGGFGVFSLTAPCLLLVSMSLPHGLLKALTMIGAGLLVTGRCLLLLPAAKAILISRQLHHKAGEGRFKPPRGG